MNIDKVKNILGDAERIKDEIKLDIHLGKVELQDKYKEIDSDYEKFKSKVEKISNVAGNSAEEVRLIAELGIESDSKKDTKLAVELAAEELKASYVKIKKLL